MYKLTIFNYELHFRENVDGLQEVFDEFLLVNRLLGYQFDCYKSDNFNTLHLQIDNSSMLVGHIFFHFTRQDEFYVVRKISMNGFSLNEIMLDPIEFPLFKEDLQKIMLGA